MSYSTNNNQPTVLMHSHSHTHSNTGSTMSFSGMVEQLNSIQSQDDDESGQQVMQQQQQQHSISSLKKRRFASLYQTSSLDEDYEDDVQSDSMSVDTDLTLEFSNSENSSTHTHSSKKRRISMDDNNSSNGASSNSSNNHDHDDGMHSSNSLKFSVASSSSSRSMCTTTNQTMTMELATLDHVSSYSSSSDDDHHDEVEDVHIPHHNADADNSLPVESSEDDDDDDANTVYSEFSTSTSASFMSLTSNHGTDQMVGEPIHLSQFAQAIRSGQTTDQFNELTEKTRCKSFFKQFGGFDISGKNKTNACQNRHGIPCYDGNRVLLHERSSASDAKPEDNQFINASFIDSVSQPHRYIATQAPMLSTTHKFWEMVFQENAHLIVCLADTNDSSQADQYWPSKINDTLQYGDRITVTLVNETRLGQSNITRRTHLVRKFDPSGKSDAVQESTVEQLHYHGWADMTAPANIRSMFLLMEEIEQIELGLKGRSLGPVVVHCSAGIGRAGTFIAAHIACEFVVAMEESHDLKIQDFNLMQLVYELRQQRPLMVYKQEQYDALHQIVYLFCTGDMLEI
eukprot:TRINITY_DN7758_c0_g1_i1.p1 TRINITY_DN7758_c0_g1~~TRINITY_DN7758_c0_g1_i1.p1  ORF type:complete len:570 (+),score=198.40 TRINITY_DN7758_c0_g1_i1:1067-2776(+)